MRRASMIVAGLLIATACRRDPPVSTNVTIVTTPSVPVGEYKVSNEGAQSITVGGVVIETTVDLPERAASTTTSVSGNNQVIVVLRGWQVVLHEGRVFVGGRDFGLTPSGSRVRLSKDGVHVGEELRGPLP